MLSPEQPGLLKGALGKDEQSCRERRANAVARRYIGFAVEIDCDLAAPHQPSQLSMASAADEVENIEAVLDRLEKTVTSLARGAVKEGSLDALEVWRLDEEVVANGPRHQHPLLCAGPRRCLRIGRNQQREWG